MKDIKVVVIGKNYTALLNMIRGAGMAGYPVTVIKTVTSIPKTISLRRITVEGLSKYADKELFVERNNTEQLLQILVSNFANHDKVVLLPTDDNAVVFINDIKEKLPANFMYAHPIDRNKNIIDYMDKAYQKELARESGLKVAQGCTVNIEGGHYTVPKDIVYPCFVKPQVSAYMKKTDMKKCDNEQELDAALQQLVSYGNCVVLIEQYMEINYELNVIGYCNSDEIFIPCLVKKIEVGNGKHKGIAILGEVSDLRYDPELHNKLVDYLKKFKYKGPIDIDLYESNNEIYFNELNIRLGAFGAAAYHSGFNIQKLVIDGLTQGTDEFPKGYIEKPFRCISEKVNLEDYADGYRSWKQYCYLNDSADCYFIYNPKDLKPYKWFKIVILRNRLKRLFKR